MLPEKTRDYLSNEALEPLWAAVRIRLEKNGVATSGSVTVTLDHAGADLLSGLLGAPVSAGPMRVRLDILDAQLRESAAQAGLATVVEILSGRPLQDRAAVREQNTAVRASVWARLDAAMTGAGLASAPWVPTFLEGIRRAGLLTRAGDEAAGQCADRFGAVLAVLGTRANLNAPAIGAQSLGSFWELAELASKCTGSAHGLDNGTLTGALVLRAAAAAFDVSIPGSAAARRELWEQLGVVTDVLSGTVLMWGLRPPGSDPWSLMMRTRADLNLVTHLTIHELRAVGKDVLLSSLGSTAFACENPQVVQAAARAGVPNVLMCLSGNPSGAAMLAVERLIAGGAIVRYHGDFDWPGIAIAGRLSAAGALPWRLGARDYEAALVGLPTDERLALEGRSVSTPWDPNLAKAMMRHGVAIHEEGLLEKLLADLTELASN